MALTRIDRRQFLVTTSALAGVSCVGFGRTDSLALVSDPEDDVAAAAASRWALGELHEALVERGVTVRLHERIEQVASEERCILVAGASSPRAREVLDNGRAAALSTAESVALVAGTAMGRDVVLASAHDARGQVYALLELADRVRHAPDLTTALSLPQPVIERPANRIRSVARLFVSDVEDKPWFRDREMWPAYLTMLAGERFNRFNLSFGIGYDFLRNVTDAYFLFVYPFLVSVPGYDVRATNLSDQERDENLGLLKFISDEAALRGIHFQLGIWTHGYEWSESPDANHIIEGLTADNHASYCRDALTRILEACPAVRGVTFRIHGESGVPEASYAFWKTVFDGVVRSGRKVEIDMHAKGMDQSMIDVALGTGMPVKISPKYWAEHLGMPYHQAAIRELEMPRETDDEFFALSSGSRRFLRYGYGDLLREDRRHGVIHRIWPGTQRLLLWGDPTFAAAYSRAFSFCGSDGVEIHEPLSFKGRRGSGIAASAPVGSRGDPTNQSWLAARLRAAAASRCAYADTSLSPRWDWEKYRSSYRVWGRHLYNPDVDPEVCRRALRHRFGGGAAAVESALASASRILPIITTAHGPSAANNTYWPEVYYNQPIVDAERDRTYGDTPEPKVFGNVSPFDPQLFSRIDDFAAELVSGERSGKYSPLEVARWLDELSEAATKSLAEADAQAQDTKSPEYRRMAIDVAIQAGLGRFFARKFRSAALYAIHERTKDRAALERALQAYRDARAAWAELAERAKGVYVTDITIGERPSLRGHWLDRLPAMDGDIADMAKKLEGLGAGGAPPEALRRVLDEVSRGPQRPSFSCSHTPPERLHRGQPLEITLSLPPEAEGTPSSVLLHYRHVHQAERYITAEMAGKDQRYRAVVPGRYTDSPYPIQYYFELKQGPEQATLHPGLAPSLTNQPYFVVRSRAQETST
ncbi:MAG: hypothetical protein GEV06_23755 [Luteitalea sp.]|nr:hypothetical protein [Luteitalea sp.]